MALPDLAGRQRTRCVISLSNRNDSLVLGKDNRKNLYAERVYQSHWASTRLSGPKGME